jgi:hypothetical protein
MIFCYLALASNAIVLSGKYMRAWHLLFTVRLAPFLEAHRHLETLVIEVQEGKLTEEQHYLLRAWDHIRATIYHKAQRKGGIGQTRNFKAAISMFSETGKWKVWLVLKHRRLQVCCPIMKRVKMVVEVYYHEF